jgi:hypothetical protein
VVQTADPLDCPCATDPAGCQLPAGVRDELVRLRARVAGDHVTFDRLVGFALAAEVGPHPAEFREAAAAFAALAAEGSALADRLEGEPSPVPGGADAPDPDRRGAGCPTRPAS